MRKLTAVTLGLTAVGIAGAATVAPGTLGGGQDVTDTALSGSAKAAAQGSPAPATPTQARPPHKQLVVHVDGIVIPILVPGATDFITVPVSNPDAGDVALQSITGVVNNDLAASCRDDIAFGSVIERGTTLTKRGTRADAVDFHVPVTFSDDASGPQECKADSYTITFTATGSGK